VNKTLLSLYGCVTVVKAAPAAGARELCAEGRREETASRVEKVSRWSCRTKRGENLVNVVRLAVFLLFCCHLTYMAGKPENG